MLGHSFAKVRVLMRDQARLSNGANRFIAMAHRLTSYLEIRIRAPQYRELTAAYCIADDRAIVYRLRADRAEGIAGFNNPADRAPVPAGIRRRLAGQRDRRARSPRRTPLIR